MTASVRLEAPQVEGWFWWRPLGGVPECVHVVNDDGWLIVVRASACEAPCSLGHLSELGTWLGPVVEPTGFQVELEAVSCDPGLPMSIVEAAARKYRPDGAVLFRNLATEVRVDILHELHEDGLLWTLPTSDLHRELDGRARAKVALWS